MLSSLTPRFRLPLLYCCQLFVVLCPMAAIAQAPDLNKVATLELQDQFGSTDSLARQLGAPVIVVVVNVRRLAMIEQWERDLVQRVPGMRFLNVADLPADAPVDLERTAATLRKRVPSGVVVLMDPAREWATALSLDTMLPNLLVFDASGQLSAQFRGRWTAELAAQVAAAYPRQVGGP